ncbi:MAG: sn-glycerol-3-phosphate ABC transporter ATP-binding protein UgpC, partial [Terrimicrobiaceae bacterium]
MAKVTLKNVYKIYPGERGKEVTAVENFSLEIDNREFVVFVGPSGCGKSTTLRMIAGLEEISKGDILIGEKRVNDYPPKDRDIAMVFQNYALYPHMSVYDNMAFGLELRKYPKAEIKKRVTEAASILGIEQFLDRRPKALSGGQRQRVAVGRAIVRQPEVFLFDEPLSNLDAKMRVQMRTEITKLHQRLQATMIYVTHDQIEAMTMGTRIVVMKDGVTQQVDSPLAIYREPKNLFVAGFLGTPPMNLVNGTLLMRDGALAFKEARGGAIEVELDDRRDAAGYVGKEVVLGFRPENCDLFSSGQTSSNNCFQAVVDFVEPMGPETYFHLQTGAHAIISRSPAGAQQ